jgi:hypothetical protein
VRKTEEVDHNVDFRIHAEAAADATMLNFAKRLPLEDSNRVGHDLGFALDSRLNMTGGLTEARSSSSSSSSHGAKLTTSTIATRHDTVEEATGPPALEYSVSAQAPRGVGRSQQSSSRTLSLASTSSDSTWSFACQSARRIKREHERGYQSEDDGSEGSFGSLSGWGVTIHDNTSVQQAPEVPENIVTCPPNSSAGLNEQVFVISDAEFDALPDWSDVEDEPEYNAPLVKDTEVWSVTSIAESDAVHTQQTLFAYKQNHPALMSDAEFASLPGWSDVEEDPGYNEPYARDADAWSVTCCSSDDAVESNGGLVLPEVHIPSGYPEIAIQPYHTGPMSRVVVIGQWQKKRKQAGEEDHGGRWKRPKLEMKDAGSAQA